MNQKIYENQNKHMNHLWLETQNYDVNHNKKCNPEENYDVNHNKNAIQKILVNHLMIETQLYNVNQR